MQWHNQQRLVLFTYLKEKQHHKWLLEENKRNSDLYARDKIEVNQKLATIDAILNNEKLPRVRWRDLGGH